MLSVIQLNGKEFVCADGYVSKQPSRFLGEINSRLLCRLYEKFGLIKIKLDFRDNLVFLSSNTSGTKVYNGTEKLLFTIKNSPCIGRVRFVFDPKDFNLSFSDLGLLSGDKIFEVLSNKPKIFVRGSVFTRKEGRTLIFAADRKMNHKYVYIIPFNDKIVLKKSSLQPPLNRQNSHIRKIHHTANKRHNNLHVNLPKNLETKPENIWIGLYENEWGSNFNFSNIFKQQEEAELARKFYNSGFTIFSTHSHNFDIGLGRDEELQSIIEITNYQPYLKGRSNTKFGIGGMITSKIQTSRIWSIKNKLKSFVIISENWNKYNWLNELIEESKQDNCYVLFTDFKGKWAEDIARIIDQLLN